MREDGTAGKADKVLELARRDGNVCRPGELACVTRGRVQRSGGGVGGGVGVDGEARTDEDSVDGAGGDETGPDGIQA